MPGLAHKLNNVPGVQEGYLSAPDRPFWAASRGLGTFTEVNGWRLYDTGVFIPWPLTGEFASGVKPYCRDNLPMIQCVGGFVRHVIDHPGCEGGHAARHECGGLGGSGYQAAAEQWLCEMGILEAQGRGLYPFPVALDFLAPLGGRFPRSVRFDYRQLADLLVELDMKA